MMNSNTQTKKQNKNKINPIIENLLKDPITFQSARYPDKISIKPSSYIVFKSFKDKKNSKSDDSNKDSDLNSNSNSIKQEMVRPKSMAEAVANYTGKKYLSKKERKEEKRKTQLEKKQEKEKDKESQINNNNNSDNNEENSSVLSDDEFQGEILENTDQAEEKNNDNDNDEIDENDDGDDDDDEDDDDNYHTADENEESQASLNGDSGNESNHEDEESNSENTSEPSEIEMELETEADILKKDLKEDNLTKKVLSIDESRPASTSSKEDEQIEKIESPIDDNLNESKLIQSKFNPKDFYDLNEDPSNNGSNNSKRILKSWGDFTKSHNALGLLNHGVTCYMNSAVQAMCHIPSLTRYLIEVHNGQHQQEISSDSVTQVLADTVAKMYKVENKRKIVYINPKKLCKRLADINCMMSEWQQEDSHEYFMSLISRLQEDSTPKGVKLNQSIIYDIFGGLLNQTVTCKNCGHISTTEQEFYDLSLGLDNRKKRSSLMIDPSQLYQLKQQIESCKSSSKDSKIQLSELLNQRILLAQEEIKSRSQTPETDEPQSLQQKCSDSNNSSNNNANNNSTQIQSDEPSTHTYSIENSIKDFFTPEIIKTDKRDQSGYVCEKCKIKTNAIKISTISRSPETLSIHLKRFRFNGQQSQKVKANVTYPEILDLTEYTTSMDSPTRYKLISVIVHQGRSVSSGHYIAHCRQPDGCWETYDDEYVNKIKSRDALSDPSAYVLIYERLTYKNTANNDNLGNKRKITDADDAENNDNSTKKRKTRKKNN